VSCPRCHCESCRERHGRLPGGISGLCLAALAALGGAASTTRILNLVTQRDPGLTLVQVRVGLHGLARRDAPLIALVQAGRPGGKSPGQWCLTGRGRELLFANGRTLPDPAPVLVSQPAGQAALMNLLRRAYDDAASLRARGNPRWVMDRTWYDRLRRTFITRKQEQERAAAHQYAVLADGVLACPACPASRFPDQTAVAEHVVQQSDPAYREPDPGDMLFAIRIAVRDGGGEPHLETPA
jgi:hypothetical protein